MRHALIVFIFLLLIGFLFSIFGIPERDCDYVPNNERINCYYARAISYTMFDDQSSAISECRKIASNSNDAKRYQIAFDCVSYVAKKFLNTGICDQINDISYSMQNRNSLMKEIEDNIKECKNRINELKNEANGKYKTCAPAFILTFIVGSVVGLRFLSRDD